MEEENPSPSTSLETVQSPPLPCISTLEFNSINGADDSRVSVSTVDDPSSSKPIKDKKKKKKSRILKGLSDQPSSSSYSSSSNVQKGIHLAYKRRSSKLLSGSGRRVGSTNLELVALPLGMSFAAVVAQVLEKKDASDERLSIDHLSSICTLAVKESLANVFDDKFDSFAKNFEKSFGTTLKTLNLISERKSSMNKEEEEEGGEEEEGEGSESNCDEKYLNLNEPAIATQIQLNLAEESGESILENCVSQDLTLACASTSMLGSVAEKSVFELARCNDLKTVEIGLALKKLKLKEVELALSYDSNNLKRSNLAMGVSKASFRVEKFKTQLEDSRHAEFLRKCIDCLVAGLFTMLVSLAYGTYVYSYEKITEVTSSCLPSQKEESKSWWMPKQVSSFNTGMYSLWCQVQVMSRILFGMFMILTIAYLLLQRTSNPRQTMPITFIVLLLGGACGFAGKLCVDTLGGHGYIWALHWEVLCSLHLLCNTCTSTVFVVLHGPVNMSIMEKKNAVVPYWFRRVVFYLSALVYLPVICGISPFATPSEWKDHIFLLVSDRLLSFKHAG